MKYIFSHRFNLLDLVVCSTATSCLIGQRYWEMAAVLVVGLTVSIIGEEKIN